MFSTDNRGRFPSLEIEPISVVGRDGLFWMSVSGGVGLDTGIGSNPSLYCAHPSSYTPT